MTQGKLSQVKAAKSKVIACQKSGGHRHEPWSLRRLVVTVSVAQASFLERGGGLSREKRRRGGWSVSGGGGRKAVAGNPAREVSTTLWSVTAKIPWPLPARTAFRCHHKFGLTRELGTKANLFYRP